MTRSLFITDYSQLSDADLISACRRGEEEAWDTLVGRYERLVYTLPVRHGLSKSEMNDVFRAVWLSLLGHLDTLGHPERVAAWLVTATRHEWRKKRSRSEEDGANGSRLEQQTESDQPEEPTPDEVVTGYKLHEGLRCAMKRLDSQCQQLLSLLYCGTASPSHTDVASRLDMPVRLIEPLRIRCLKKLRHLQTDFVQ